MIEKKEHEWAVVYASAMGSLHVKENLPCQDACAFKDLGAGWGIATVADGAGSCENSDKGAQQTVQLAVQHFANLVHRGNWIAQNHLPTQKEWAALALTGLKAVREDLQTYSQQQNLAFESLSCTLIMLIYSPLGLLLTHIGDGRAGYLDAQQIWHSLMTPFRGEEANQTIFISSDFEGYVESNVIKGETLAFCLLSDGCEKSAFECNLYDKTKGVFYDPNRPFPKFFDPNLQAIKSLKNQNKTQEEMNMLWQSFLEGGNPQLKGEPDDKTLVLGVKMSA